MAISKVTFNNATLMDTTGVTVDESNLLTGNTALDNSGTLITGTATAGEDLPVFNITWDGDYPSAQPISITCNKTFAECRAMINGVQSSNYSAILHEIVSYTSISDDDLGITGMTGTYRSISGSESIDYFAGWENGIPYIKVTYLPNGTIESTRDNLPTDSVLNAASNGTYTQINGRYKTVNVALPSGTEGTPVATKGSVSNHSVTVTPSVTNTAGVITGGTHTGTAVTVTASELDSGTKSIAENGTGIDVVGYAAVDVAVPSTPQYTAHITGNSTGTDMGSVEYNNTNYYTSGSEFNFASGDTCTLYAVGSRADASIYVDGVRVEYGAGGYASYTYTLPSHSIEIKIEFSSAGKVYVTPLTLEITSNGEYDVTDYAVADVDLPAGTEGTPVATKGTVSNHSVTVTPSVTNTAGVITGGTHTGTAVTVDVTELESGTKTITENGTGISVSGYSAVDVNVSGGGGVTVESLSVTQNGTYTAPTGKAYTPVTVNVSGGGSANKIRFIDYDGTVLHEYTPAQYAQLSALPANPSHTGLTAQGWNWTKQQIDDYLEDYPDADVNVGQMYITASGKTEIDVRFEDSNFLSPYLMLAVDGEVSVDWGDNSSADTVTGTSLTANVFTQHVYSATGSYTIKITSVSGNYTFRASDNNSSHPASSVLAKDSSTNAFNKSYAVCVIAIRLGNGVTSIGANAFQNCYSLTSITIPDTVTSIGTYAFCQCFSLTSLTIPDGVTVINTYVFYYCFALTSVAIPDTVTSIGTYAFYQCYSLTSLTIPDGVTKIGGYTFQYCCSLASIVIPDTVTSISTNMFSYCYVLTSVTISDSVTSIGSNMFNNCYSLTSVTIPDGITSIGTSAFSSCYSLASVTIADTVTSIGQSAFSGCYSLTSLTIPDGVTSIGSSAFTNCYSLASVTIPSGCTVGRNAFQGCALFISPLVPLPNDATSIQASEFQNCYSLTSITIPDTVTSIGNYAFQNCYSLTSLTIPDGVTSIGNNAFQNCQTLTSLNIPSGVTSIATTTFEYCASLISLTIPSTVTNIGSYAFRYCYSMREYHFQRTTPPTLSSTNAFGSIPSDCIIYVPYSADHSILNAYKTATNYTSVASKMQEEPQT